MQSHRNPAPGAGLYALVQPVLMALDYLQVCWKDGWVDIRFARNRPCQISPWARCFSGGPRAEYVVSIACLFHKDEEVHFYHPLGLGVYCYYQLTLILVLVRPMDAHVAAVPYTESSGHRSVLLQLHCELQPRPEEVDPQPTGATGTGSLPKRNQGR